MPEDSLGGYIRAVRALGLDLDATAIAEALWLAARRMDSGVGSWTAPDPPGDPPPLGATAKSAGQASDRKSVV